MKQIFTAIILLSGPLCFAQTSPDTATKQPLNPTFSITVAPPAAPIRLGSPINDTVTVKNISGKEIYIETTRSQDARYLDFAYLLLKDGHEVETTFFHRKITGRNRPDDPQEVWAGSYIILPHPPGKIYEMPIDLKRLYEIKDPGVYTLEVSRFDEDSKRKVRSNTLTLTVVP